MRTGLVKLGDAIGHLPGVISQKRYNFLKTFEGTLSDSEKVQIQEYEKWQAEILQDKLSLFNQRSSIPAPPKKKRKSVPLDWMMEQFKGHWQYNQRRELVVYEHNEKQIVALCKYFSKNEGPLDLNKGILLRGGTGTGKSSIMKAFHTLSIVFYQTTEDDFMNFFWSNCTDLVNVFEDTSVSKYDFFHNYRGGNRMFDDFGMEDPASRFGITNVMKKILENRYHDLRHKTYMSTNLTGDEILKEYGFRVNSRINEMFNIVELEGNDFRKIN